MAIRDIVAFPILLVLVALTGGLSGLTLRGAPSLALRGTVMFAYAAYLSWAGGSALRRRCISLYFVAPMFLTLLSGVC